MGPILKFLISLERLVRAGGIKRIEQALDFAKREFGEVSPLFQKQIQRVFDKVNKPKVGKDVKKEGEVVPFKKEGIETLETLTDAKTLKDEGSVTLDRIQEATEKLKEDPKLQQILRDMGVEDTPDLDSTDNLRSAIKNMEDRMRVGNNESNIRATLREFLERRLKDGTLDIPDAAERDAIEKVYQGGVDPIEVFRKAYGEDALIAVDDVFDQYGDNIMRESNNYKEIGDKFEKLFKFNRGFYDMGELPVPKKQYGYDEGLMTNQEFTEKLKKDLREKEILEDFDPTDRTKNAQGGLNTITLDKEFTKVFEDASSKKLAARDEKQATREKRYRELIASNKFPELNNFFREKITTRVQANIGGAFTTGQRRQRANQSYQDYLARQRRSGTSFQPGTGNTPVVNFPTINPPTTTPTPPTINPPTTTPAPPSSGGGGGSRPPSYTPPNTGGGGSGGGNTFYGKGNTGGGGSGGGGSTQPFDPGLPIGAASGAEAIAAYKKYLAGVDRSTTPFQMFDQWRKGTNKYQTDQLLYDLTSEDGQSQYLADKAYLDNLQGWKDPRGGTGREAVAAYEKYLAGLTGGTPLGFDSWRRGTAFEKEMNFLEDDFRKLIGLKDLVNKGQESGNFKYDLGGGYTGEDPRGTGPGYTEEGEGSQKAPPGYEGDDSETFLEKKKREEEEAAEAEAAKKEQEEGGGADYFPEMGTIDRIEEASKTVDTSDPSQYSNFINANANATVGKDSRGKIFTLGNLIKAGLFIASGGLSAGGIRGAITTAAKQYAKQKAVEYAKEKIGIGGSEELPDLAISNNLSNNLIGSNNNLQLNKGGRVKLYNGGIPGFTEAEIAQRRRQQLMDSRERNRTSYSPVPSPIAPGGIPGGSPIPPQLNPQPIDQMPTLPPAMGEQGALPGFGTDNPGGEEYIATPGGGGSEYQTYITELPGAEPQPIDQMPMLPPDRPITESPFPGTGAYTPPGSENIMDGFQKYLDDSGAMNRPMTADVRSYKLPDGTVIQGNSTMKGITDKYLESIGQPPTTDVESQSGNNTYDLGGQKVEDTIDLDKIMNMDTFQYEKFMGGLSPEKRSEVQNQLDNMGPMGIAPPPGLMPGMPSGDPMLRQYGVSMTDYESMSPDQQDDLHAAVRYTQQYGAEPYTQSMILKERGINPDQFIKADGSYDRLALTQAKLASDIQEGIDDGYLSGVTLTGNESFQDLVDLDKKYMDAIMEEMANTPSYNPGTGGYYGGGGEPVYTPGEQVKRVIGYQPSDRSPGNSLMASGGRAGFKFGSMLETSNPDFGKQKKDKSHEYLLRLLKNKQTKQLNNSLKKMVSKSRQVKDKSPEQIAKAMKKLQQLKSFYGKR